MTTTAKARDNLASLVVSLYDIRQQKTALERAEKDLLTEIKLLADPNFDALEKLGNRVEVSAGGLLLSRVSGVSRTIKAELLLERGVSPEIVSCATKTVPYYQYRVKEACSGRGGVSG